METMEVYVRGNSHIPSRFNEYALRTNHADDKWYADLGFNFSKKDTELYKSLSEEVKKKIEFSYINGIKQIL
jgi:hypothetical protein